MQPLRAAVHVWQRFVCGETLYLCGIHAHEVVAGVVSDGLDYFPDDVICPDCLVRFRRAETLLPQRP